MKRSFAAALVTGALVASFAMPVSAMAWSVTGGGGNQTQNPYGYWYAGKEACAQEGCHSAIAEMVTPHSEMVKDVKANPDELWPTAGSGLWPFTSPFGGISVLPRDVYLQVGDDEGFLEYIGPENSPLAVNMKPADDLPVWSPANFLLHENRLEEQTGKLGNSVYTQSCAQCHNVGLTRPSYQTYTLPSGAVMTTKTPSTVSELGIQCEACHGSGKNPGSHRDAVPGVVGGYQILKAQTCGQCHVGGTTPQKNVNNSAFGNPNGFTTDQDLSLYLTPYSTVETEGQMMKYVNNPSWPGGTKPKFLPNGADFSMRHTYYNEWLVNKVPSEYGGDHGHADPVNEAVKSYAAGGNTKCYKCHSGLGFLNRINAKSPSGKRIVGTYPTPSIVATNEPGISCMVCHTGHIEKREGGGYDSLRRWGNGEEVSCGDCHNWQFEALDQAVQSETIKGVSYTRPAENTRSRHPQRELVSGGHGGEDGLGGLWGVEPTSTGMPNTECTDCHMPRTHKEGMPANDDGSKVGTRMSHRFHVVLPGDAARWKLRPGGDSCVTGCHTGDVADYTRQDMQSWIDQKQSAVTTASVEATSVLNDVAADLGLTDWLGFIAAQPAGGAASTLPAAKWAMLQHAAQNVDFVMNDGSVGIHNPKYALAGLVKARLWAQSADASLYTTITPGPANGSGMTVSGSLLDSDSNPIWGACLILESSADGGASWQTVSTAKPGVAGVYSMSTGRIVGTRAFRVRFTPSEGVDYLSDEMPVTVPVTTVTVTPAGATSSWLDIPSAQVTMTATPGGAVTYYTLTGATVLPQTVYSGPITITAEGRTDVHYWSTDGNGVEATQSVPVFIDRAAPSIGSDIAAVYQNKATVHAWASDTGAGVESMEYTFDGVDADVDDDDFTFETYKLGKNDLVVSATDDADRSTTTTLSVWVKATPTLTASPTGTKKISRNKSVKFATHASRGSDGHGGEIMYENRTIVMQRWSGRTWYTWKKFNSGSGDLSWTKKFTSKGTSYWRWYVPADGYTYRAYSPVMKVVVK